MVSIFTLVIKTITNNEFNCTKILIIFNIVDVDPIEMEQEDIQDSEGNTISTTD